MKGAMLARIWSPQPHMVHEELSEVIPEYKFRNKLGALPGVPQTTITTTKDNQDNYLVFIFYQTLAKIPNQ